MRILALSSNQPNFEHSHSHNTVLAVLLEAFAEFGHRVGWMVAGCDDYLQDSTLHRLEAAGARYLGDLSNELELESSRRLVRVAVNLRKVFFPRNKDDLPRFRDLNRTLATLRRVDFEAILLFWDTWFEHLLPAMGGLPVFGYLARPRYAAPMSRLESGMKPSEISDPVRRWLLYRLLQHQRRRHLKRIGRLCGASNICAIDARAYRQAGVSCSYIPNTWPDAFGQNWLQKRREAESAAPSFGILGNIGTLHATGNRFGMTFLATEILPRLEQELVNEEWKINICGRGELVPQLRKRLNHPRVALNGFVPDIDQKMLANSVFLLCNNAGPYTGGYTRVVYAMSSGTCLVAHKRLAESMPEVQHRRNALLGESGEEIAALLSEAYRNAGLRERLGVAARRTYEEHYRPKVVANRLIKLMADTSL